MKLVDSNGRVVVDLVFEPCDNSASIVSASYLDDGSPVPENELDYLTEAYLERCSDWAFEHAIGMAEDLADLQNDR